MNILFLAFIHAGTTQEKPMSNSSAAVESQTVSPMPAWIKDSSAKLERELVAKYGPQQKERGARGLHQVGEFWRAPQADPAVFEEFVRAHFAGTPASLPTMDNDFAHLRAQL